LKRSSFFGCWRKSVTLSVCRFMSDLDNSKKPTTPGKKMTSLTCFFAVNDVTSICTKHGHKLVAVNVVTNLFFCNKWHHKYLDKIRSQICCSKWRHKPVSCDKWRHKPYDRIKSQTYVNNDVTILFVAINEQPILLTE